MRNRDLEARVTAELRWDPKVESRQVTVSADGGAVTLRGVVGSLRQKFDARNAAQRVRGVTSVSDRLTVLIPAQDRPGDADLRADVLLALALNGSIPASTDALVQDGLITLTGTVTFQYQRDEAELICASVPGALGIKDETTLIRLPSRGQRRHAAVQQAIRAAFRRSAGLAVRDLSTDARADGTVIVAGTVTSWAEHDEALAAVWSAPGVTDVDDRIVVAYRPCQGRQPSLELATRLAAAPSGWSRRPAPPRTCRALNPLGPGRSIRAAGHR
jgi:osmotically-inducible protein OsmY